MLAFNLDALPMVQVARTMPDLRLEGPLDPIRQIGRIRGSD